MSRNRWGFLGGMRIRKETYSIPYDVLFEASLRSVQQLGWKLISHDREAGEVKAQTRTTLRSWGENISIYILQEATGITISILSEPDFQLFDWGKSRENEEAFHEVLKKLISR